MRAPEGGNRKRRESGPRRLVADAAPLSWVFRTLPLTGSAPPLCYINEATSDELQARITIAALVHTLAFVIVIAVTLIRSARSSVFQ